MNINKQLKHTHDWETLRGTVTQYRGETTKKEKIHLGGNGTKTYAPASIDFPQRPTTNWIYLLIYCPLCWEACRAEQSFSTPVCLGLFFFSFVWCFLSLSEPSFQFLPFYAMRFWAYQTSVCLQRFNVELFLLYYFSLFCIIDLSISPSYEYIFHFLLIALYQKFFVFTFGGSEYSIDSPQVLIMKDR